MSYGRMLPPNGQVEPVPHDLGGVEVRSQSDVHVEEILLLLDAEALAALRVLHARGYTTDDVAIAYQTLQPLPTTRVRERQAMRHGLSIRVQTAARRIFGERGINPNGRELDTRHLSKTNLIVMIAAINNQVNIFVSMGTGQRHNFSREMLERIYQGFDGILDAAITEVFDGD